MCPSVATFIRRVQSGDDGVGQGAFADVGQSPSTAAKEDPRSRISRRVSSARHR